jgi:zinc transport system ATP-binding protein
MSDATEPVVELQDVVVEYPGGIRAVDGVSLRVSRPEFLGLLGPNGAGKSTLVSLILGLQKPTRGTVRLFGDAVRPESLRRVGYVPQRPQPTYPDFPATVLETVLIGRAARARPFRSLLWGRDREKADEVLKLLDIEDLRDRRIGQLSGGQTQRVFVAKGLVADPDLLILDEPTSGMDAPSRRGFYALLARLNRDLGITIILTSHDVHSVTRLASRIAFMSGRIFFDGDPAEFAQHPIHSDLEDFPEEAMPKP